MPHDPRKPGRKSIRLKGYDYSQPGAYFVTVVTQGRADLFGQVRGGDMHLNEAGQMVAAIWVSLAKRFPQIELDIYQVMPDHFHGIIVIHDKSVDEKPVGAGLVPAPSRATTRVAPTNANINPALGDIIAAFKSITTLEYIRGVRGLGWAQFYGRLWQRNYFERVIRDEREWDRIRRYIQANPLNWARDRESPPDLS
jgi:putative transposase